MARSGWAFCLFLFMGIFLSCEAQVLPTRFDLAAKTSFPVIVKRTVSSTDAPGTAVKLGLISGVMVGHTVVPKGAVFHGRLVECATGQTDNTSRLALIVDSVEWKHQSIELRGVPVGFGRLEMTVSRNGCEQQETQPVSRTAVAPGFRAGEPVDNWGRTSRSSDDEGCFLNRSIVDRYSGPDDARGISFRRTERSCEIPVQMISSKKKLVLHSGTLLLIRAFDEGGRLEVVTAKK